MTVVKARCAARSWGMGTGELLCMHARLCGCAEMVGDVVLRGQAALTISESYATGLGARQRAAILSVHERPSQTGQPYLAALSRIARLLRSCHWR